MGHIHFIRSGGINGVGKTLLASMLIEYIRLHKISGHFIDAQEFPKVGIQYSPELNTGKSRIYFDPLEPTRVDRLIELAAESEVVVDLPANREGEANRWVEDIADLIRDESLIVVDWFIHNMTLPSWQAHERQVTFWKKLELNVEIPQLFLMNAHGPIIRGCLPPDVQKICWDNQVALAIFPVLKDVPLDERPIGEIIDKSCYPYRKSLYEWQARLFRLFKATLLFQELPPPDISGAKTVRDLLAIVKAGFPSNNAKQEEIEDCPF